VQTTPLQAGPAAGTPRDHPDTLKGKTMSAPTAPARTWTLRQIMAEATDAIDDLDPEPYDGEILPAVASLTAAVYDVDHDTLDYSCVRASRMRWGR